MEHLKVWVKEFNPVTFIEAIKKACDVTMSSSSSRNYSYPKPPLAPKEEDKKTRLMSHHLMRPPKRNLGGASFVLTVRSHGNQDTDA